MIFHPIPPIYSSESSILILGSFPSVKSREQAFFYGHPQNRFWKVLAAVFAQPIPSSIEEKKAFLLKNHIALWDVIASCEIIGSADSSIKDAVPNDIRPILEESSVGRIFLNGGTAKRLYDRYIFPVTGIKGVLLPSTSPTNAAKSLDALVDAWGIIRED